MNLAFLVSVLLLASCEADGLDASGNADRASTRPRDVRSADERSYTIDADWNAVADIILEDARRTILRDGLDEIVLQDAEETFKKRWGFILIDSRFTATGGRLKSFSSIRRLGNVTVVSKGPVFTMTSEIGLAVAEIRYADYAVELWQQKILGGEIRGKIGKNRMRIVFEFESRDDRCVTTLRDITVLEIGEFQVDVSGLGPLDEYASLISSSVANKREDQIIREIQHHLSKDINKSLADFECDQYAALLI